MREILFKAKGKYTGEWHQGLLARLQEDYCVIREERKQIIKDFFCDPSTICQYKGFTDKDGQKIWENDICRRILLPTKRIKTNFRIAYVPLKCCLSAIDLDGRNVTFLSDYINNQYEVEVIGNIFEH